jgi:hypothetical protein
MATEAPGKTGIDPVIPELEDENNLLGFAKTLNVSK